MFIFFLIFSFIFFLIQFDKKALPIVLSISQKYATTEVNNKINFVIESIISDMKVKSSDFYENTIDKNNKLNYLEVNSMLINEICNKSAVKISKELNKMKENKITLPIGIISGFGSISNFGPKIKIEIMPMGDAMVDYETKFDAVGINQINFQVWLNIETNVNIINPFYNDEIKIKRKLMLVNTIFNGDVPNTYLGLQNENIK